MQGLSRSLHLALLFLSLSLALALSHTQTQTLRHPDTDTPRARAFRGWKCGSRGFRRRRARAASSPPADESTHSHCESTYSRSKETHDDSAHLGRGDVFDVGCKVSLQADLPGTTGRHVSVSTSRSRPEAAHTAYWLSSATIRRSSAVSLSSSDDGDSSPSLDEPSGDSVLAAPKPTRQRRTSHRKYACGQRC